MDTGTVAFANLCVYTLFICTISPESKNKKLSGTFPNTYLFQEMMHILRKLLADVSEANLTKTSH